MIHIPSALFSALEDYTLIRIHPLDDLDTFQRGRRTGAAHEIQQAFCIHVGGSLTTTSAFKLVLEGLDHKALLSELFSFILKRRLGIRKLRFYLSIAALQCRDPFPLRSYELRCFFQLHSELRGIHLLASCPNCL